MRFLRNVLEKRSNKNVSTDTFIELAESVLQNNYFEFNEPYLKQIRGTAIGTKFAPPYAIIYMTALEEDSLGTLIKKPWLWWRFIGDNFMIWQHVEDELKIYLKKLNNFHPSINFTCEYSREKVNYLDVQVIVREGKLITDLHVKQTDSHQYLDPSSCHPYHCTKSIHYSQALRTNRICSENISFDLRCNQHEGWLIKRNYNATVVRRQILKARAFSRDTLLDKTEEVRNSDRLVLTLTYHPSIKNFQNVLNEAHILLTPNKEHRKVFGDKPPMIGWRKPKSLKDHLASAKVKCEPSSDNKSAPCCRSRCQICPFIEETKTFQNKDKSETFDIKKGILNCSSNLVVYLIECKSCSKQYVGSTITPFRSRFNNYKSGARKVSKMYPKKCNVYQEQFHRHFNYEGHNGIEDWKITITDRAEKVLELRRRESYWQHRLDTFIPDGLNERFVSIPML